MSHPRISVFASLAKEQAAPVRVIEGQATKLARTMHQIALDTVHDEIVVSNSIAQAILFFRAEANGEEPPLRIIQGPKTKLSRTDNVTVDPLHNEVFTAQRRTNSILVFNREANGDVEPLRIIHGPKTKLRSPGKIVVDYINNLLIVTNASGGFLIFNRTDQGDVAPQTIVSSPNIRGGGGPSKIALYPEGKKIFISISEARTRERRTREHNVRSNSIGVWKYTADGEVNVSLWAIIRDTTEPGQAFEGVALNPEAKEIMVFNKQHPPALHVYHVPEVFE
ncbi:hypothetical protein MYX82_09495 [Acidobacteria bacterium AH-259-D05]|nr:hypothetical protein [Acidobacteria bacterium AH-259-D05]